MPAIKRTTFTEFIWRLHRFVYRASGGRVGGAIGGAPVLLLTTTGRHSGEPRPVTLTCFEDGGRFVVVASNAGEDRHPAWWLNLKEHPDATVLIGGTTTRMRAAEAVGEERKRLWMEVTRRDPPTRSTDDVLPIGLYPSWCCSLQDLTQIAEPSLHGPYQPLASRSIPAP